MSAQGPPSGGLHAEGRGFQEYGEKRRMHAMAECRSEKARVQITGRLLCGKKG